jgi:CRP-like cAMP-binding protein
MADLTETELLAMPVFKGLSHAEVSHVLPLLRVRDVPANTILFSVDQPGEIAYIIRRGTVKVHSEQADGSDVILAILGKGELLGELGLIDGLGRSATAVTMEHTRLAWMDRTTFLECLQKMPGMAHNMVNVLSRRLRLANAQIESLATQDVAARIACQVIALARQYGEPGEGGRIVIPLRLTQGDFASLIGATRVSVNHVWVNFRKRNFISQDDNLHLVVHDLEGLARESN